MIKRICILFWAFPLFVYCSNDSEEKKPPPVVESTSPVDGAVDVNVSAEVSVTFDEVVELVENHGISVNSKQVAADASFKKILIDAALEYGTQYEVTVPAGAVVNTFGVPSEHDVTFSFTTRPPVEITSDLTVSNPSSEVQNVYNFLKENYGSKIISGAIANVSWNINEAEWVYQHTGKYPAMNTFDYIHLNAAPANWIDYSDTQVVEDWWANNGLVSACWHWNVPVSEGSTEYTYKPSETTFSAANATVEGTWENDIVNADLEEIAGYLNLLKNKNIPVIWRPLHEAAGNIYEYDGGKAWFWWGADGAQAFKNLWAYMFEYFQQQGLNNLIWVWTTQTKDDEFYPGDEYVDIIGRDIYNNNDAADIASQFDAIQDAYPTKMVTLSEMGSIANITEQWNSGALWSWFMPWYDYERTNDPGDADFSETNHTHADITWWEDAFSHDAVITRDEMPDLK
ncbi:glycosyl hydrolase [Anaerophaga thermohalophila]|uniref:glycosyl hydrolase n=1 Tax=Anaerophaga thermohalophila TaxID=177400 RepID=UPI000237BE9A|nr:glycosyl hydrolase [Anaerophaga thermohalophila]